VVIKKRVGIKYCGGCNPSYERVKWVERLKNQLGDCFLFLPSKEPNIDLLVFVSGCLRGCAFEEGTKKVIPYFSATQEGDFDHLISFLKSFDKKGDPL